MKITGYNILKNMEGRLSGVDEPQAQSRPDRVAIASGYINDSVQLSNNAIEFSRIKNLVNVVSETREDMVGAILNEIRGGDYKVSSEQIASKLLSEHIMDALLGDHVGR